MHKKVLFRFMSGGSTMELIFYVIQLINKNREKKRKLIIVFIDLKKHMAESLLRYRGWFWRKKGFNVVRINNMHDEARTSIKNECGDMEDFSIESVFVFVGYRRRACERRTRRITLVYDVCRWYDFNSWEHKFIGRQTWTLAEGVEGK